MPMRLVAPTVARHLFDQLGDFLRNPICLGRLPLEQLRRKRGRTRTSRNRRKGSITMLHPVCSRAPTNDRFEQESDQASSEDLKHPSPVRVLNRSLFHLDHPPPRHCERLKGAKPSRPCGRDTACRVPTYRSIMGRKRRSHSALPTTVTEESAMAAPARTGLNSTPNTG